MFLRRLNSLIHQHACLRKSLLLAVNSSSCIASSSRQRFSLNNSEAIYLRLKETARFLSQSISAESIKQTFEIVDRIGYTHMNSLADIEEALKASTVTAKKVADNEKFPINSEQIIHMLQLILKSKTVELPLSAATHFACSLVETNLVKLNDNWMKVLVDEALQSHPEEPVKALEIYERLCRFQPYPKVFPISLFMILSVLRKGNQRFEAWYRQIKQGSRYPHYIEGAVLLANNESLVFLDQLKNANRQLEPDDLRHLCKLAVTLKKPEILEPLVQLYHILPKHHDSCLQLYNTLVVLYGQLGNLDAIDVLWRSLREQIRPQDRRYYKHVFRRCHHFFRCNNYKTPSELFSLLQKLGDF